MTEYICKEVQTENGGYLEAESELIRCADCKYWSTETEQTSMPNMRRCTWWRNIGTFPIDFCSRAERRG